jgi:hypothetical protein
MNRRHIRSGRVLSVIALLCVAVVTAQSADLHAPAPVRAGQGFAISLDGSGSGTFYLIGPDHIIKRKVTLGGELQVASSDVHTAGRYQMILCQRECSSATFEVQAAQPARISFFLHPSRVPVSSRDSIDATAWVFDQYFNLVVTPTAVDFQIKPATGAGFTRQATTRNGVTSMQMDSTQHEGKVQVTAALSNPGGRKPLESKVEEVRVIQQVASDACRLHMNAVASGNRVTLQTDPVRDCSGNALPDGTIVSFTTVDRAGRSSVDAPIKKGIARTQLTVDGPARISVACGVALGNEVTLGGTL